MAVNKICTSHAGTQGAMKNCISYVLRDAKVHDGYCAITGPYPYDEINLNNVYRAFVDEKKIWGKTGGREYMHSIISFHKDEKITYAQALQFGKDLAENDTFYKDFQTLIAVHQDTEHIHIHFVTNSVSFIDGHKEHHSQKDTLSLMNRTNLKCQQEGYSTCKKGFHMDGSEIEKGQISSWNKDVYQFLKNESKESYSADCGLAVMKSLDNSKSKEEFISLMEKAGWKVIWEETRKHISFQNGVGNKIRDTTLEKLFNIQCDKESLNHEFARKAEQQNLNRFYREVESSINRNGFDKKTVETNSKVTGRVGNITKHH